jgi:putative transposase
MSRHPEHLATFDYVGPHRYSLTFCTDSRRPCFTEAPIVELVLKHFLQQAQEQGFAIVAYCFMPDHVHLLIEGLRADSDCKRFISRAKQFSGYYYSRLHERRLWQRYGFERVVRDEEQTIEVARNILANPLRARLVADVREYRFSGSSVGTVDELIEHLRTTGAG